MEIALRSLAVLLVADGDDPPDQVPASLIHGKLVAGGWLSGAVAAQVSVMREMGADSGFTPEAASSLIAPGKAMIENVGVALSRWDLGTGDQDRAR